MATKTRWHANRLRTREAPVLANEAYVTLRRLDQVLNGPVVYDDGPVTLVGPLIIGTDPDPTSTALLRVGGALRSSGGYTMNNAQAIVWLDNTGASTNQGFLQYGSDHEMRIATLNTVRWRVLATGHLIVGASADNTFDIGASGATRPRTGYFGTSVIVGTDPGGTSAVRVGGSVVIAGNEAYRSVTSGSVVTDLLILFSDDVYVGFVNELILRSGSAARWKLNSTGHLLAVTDNAVDIGASGATRPRDVFLAGKAVIGTELRIDGEVGGAAGMNTITGTSDLTANSTGVGTIKFKGATSRDSVGFIKVFIGTTAHYIPCFDAITG